MNMIEEIEKENKELRDALVDMCIQFGCWRDSYGGLVTGGSSALEHAFDALGWEEPQIIKKMQCDEPGCKKQSMCGTMTVNGYRHTCTEHAKGL